MSIDSLKDRYDVIVAGARVAGASTAMLLARAGLDVLVIDPTERGRDTLSTHALMRGAVVQLYRWGLLDTLVQAGTPVIRSTTFHYGPDTVRVPIKPGDGIEGLYAPRRTLLDRTLIEAAEAAGTHVVHGLSLQGLTRGTDGGRVVGARISDAHGTSRSIASDLVVGADGRTSRVAREVRARASHAVPHATASIYGYWPDIEGDGYQWYFDKHLAIGTIPTNDAETCVFVSVPPSRLVSERGRGLDTIFFDVVHQLAPDVHETMAGAEMRPKLRGFAGAPSLLRESTGPGWALVGDAGYFKDPLTAHGMTDALRDAEMLARAVVQGSDAALRGYEEARDALSIGLLEVTSRVASLEWDLDEIRELHLTLSKEMSAEVDAIRTWDAVGPARTVSGGVPT